MFSVSTASRLTGLSPEVLRAWERRHGAVRPERDSSGRRSYGTAEVTRLKLLKRLVDLGLPIRQIASQSLPELQMLAREADDDDSSAMAAEIGERAIAALLRHDIEDCETVLGLAAAVLPAGIFAWQVLSPLLRKVGVMWSRGDLDIFQEHALTAAARRVVMGATKAVARSGESVPSMVIGTLGDEHHELGSLSAAYIAAARGIRAIYLGPDLPAAELAHAVEATESMAVGLSLVGDISIAGAMEQIADLRAALPDNVQVWLGGPAAEALDREEVPAGCVVIGSLGDYETRLDMLRLPARTD